MEALLRKQEDSAERMSRAYANYKKSPKERLVESYIESRLENLCKVWDVFTEVHSEIVGLVKREDKPKFSYFSNDVYETMEDMYIEFMSKLKCDLKQCAARPSTSASGESVRTSSGCEVKLLQIKLPEFGGKYDEWVTFKDMFVSIIHNNASLNNVQKLHYLKGSLAGEPQSLLRNFATTEANYEEAWVQLTRRYDNKRYNCNEVLKSLFAQRNITSESASAIKQLVDTTSTCLKSLENLKISTAGWDPMIVHLTVSRLNPESRKQWEYQVNQSVTTELPTWAQLESFLESRFRTIEMTDGNRIITPKQAGTSKKAFHAAAKAQRVESEKSESVCPFCSSKHMLHQCKKFEMQSPEERTEFVRMKRLCFNCLSSSHGVRFCRQSTCCRECGRKHHTLLHFIQEHEKANWSERERECPRLGRSGSPIIESSFSSGSQRPRQQEPTERVRVHFAKEESVSEVLLATARVRVRSANGSSYIARALIDQGSEASFVSEATVQSMGLKRVRVNGVVSGIGETRTKSMVSFRVESLINPEFSMQVNAFVLRKLTSLLPSCEVELRGWSNIVDLPLADPTYGSPGGIDLILGVDVYSEIMLDGLVKHLSLRGPIAQNTTLGWILSGRLGGEDVSGKKRYVSLHVQVNDDDQQLRRFWEIEREPDGFDKSLTKEESRCEEFYAETTSRDAEGRYVVRLPLKSTELESFPEASRAIAMRRFEFLEKRLIKNPEAHEQYAKVIDDYLVQGHMEEITCQSEIDNPRAVYLPHHAVIREDKQTTKVRVVYDASCKGRNNVSLNDNCMIGPKLQQDLRHILLRWRSHRICLVADLVQMYRQIKVHESDTDYQRILWRASPDDEIKHYRLLRLTFGTACAPYLAVKSLLQLAKDEADRFHVASKITLDDFYMDDLLTGCETFDEAMEIYNQLNELMAAGGFTLQKWCCNSEGVLHHIQGEGSSDKIAVLKEDDTMKILGVTWNKSVDSFEYVVSIPESDEKVTKRKVLSCIGRLYDPMGWIAPVIVQAKVFIQNLWRCNLDWDEVLPIDLLSDWNRFKEDLVHLKELLIPRWVYTRSRGRVELHVFADASQVAYAAAVYTRVMTETGDVYVNLVTAKTKVAPIDKLSIPRLDLCAALLGARLIFEVSKVMQISRDKLYAWTDSSIVLAWLAAEPGRWSTFVGNRVAEIMSMLDREQWRHVSTKDNPADCASRGLASSRLVENELWWHGPEFLCQAEICVVDSCHQEFQTNEEERQVKGFVADVQLKENFIWTRFSDLKRGLRVLAYCRRFLSLRLPSQQRDLFTRHVGVDETSEALLCCVRETQRWHFDRDLHMLESRGHLSKKSALFSLSPFMDRNGVMRVGGRTHLSQMEFDKRHPIILPSVSHLAKLIIAGAHSTTLHGGPQVMLNFIRPKYWIIRARQAVKKFYRQCVTCLRYSRQNNNQLMGQLPAPRVTPTRPFEVSGVDYTGFFKIRFSPGRGTKTYKGYVCLFVCLSTKAVHLELVSDLTAQGFIAAFRRFVSRRGHCRELYSDNGTNFVAANKDLKHMLNRAVSEFPDEVSKLLTKEGTVWHFIPPLAPNFGGLWEAGVRSTKTHLKRVVGVTVLTFEEFSTVLTQVEACLNSRPLTGLSDNPSDPLPLTPGHFLVGEPLIVLPNEDLTKVNVSGMKRWRLTQKIVSDFWKRWSQEYLVTLNQRHKWGLRTREVQLDDVVLIKDQNLPPAKWLMGRIMIKHTGKDGVTRVVSIKTQDGLVKRPCNKLCFLN